MRVLTNLKVFCLSLVILMGFQAETLHAQTGKVAGTVTNAETGEPIIGANVLINERWVDGEVVEMDYPQGGAANDAGRYFIINIHPGTYNVRASAIGYGIQVQTRVQVSVDRTAEVNFELEPEAIAGEEVEVIGYTRDGVDPERTSTQQTYAIEDIQDIAGVTDLGDILNLQADVVDNHFRGGRVGETNYLLGGASIQNPLSNERVFEPMITGLEQVEVITSGFSAKYGNAQSGVVNMVPKEGGDSWTTRIEVRTDLPHYKSHEGSWFDSDNLWFWDELKNSEEWVNGYVDEGSIEPWQWDRSPFNRNTAMDSTKIATLQSALFAETVRRIDLEHKSQVDNRIEVSAGGPLTKQLRLFIAGQQSKQWPEYGWWESDLTRQLMANLTYRISNNDKLTLTTNYNYRNDQRTDGSRFGQYVEEGERIFRSRQIGLNYNHVFSQSTFMQAQITQIQNSTDYSAPFLPRSTYVGQDEGDSFGVYGAHRFSMPIMDRVKWLFPFAESSDGQPEGEIGYEQTTTYDMSASITSQINSFNLVEAGIQFQQHNVDVDLQTSVNPQELAYEAYQAFPYEGAIYVQDKLEYESLIANFGLRFDFYQFNHKYYTDRFAPFKNPEYDADVPYYLRESYYDKDKATQNRTELVTQISPRLGLSYPITERSAIHFNYGNFLQRPQYSQTFFIEEVGTGDTRVVQRGNPNLEPERTTSYDIGVLTRLPYGFTLDASAYYKDVVNLVQQAYFKDENQNTYATFVNRDYADIKGFHVNIEKRGRLFSSYLRYNWQVATGKSATAFDAPVTFLEDPAPGVPAVDIPDPEDIFLDYDRRHRIVLNGRYSIPNSSGPEVFGIQPLENMSFSATYRFMTGRPFTFDTTGSNLRFNKRTPSSSQLQMRIGKRFQIMDTQLQIFLEGFNLLNNIEYHYNRVFADAWVRRIYVVDGADEALVNTNEGSNTSYPYRDLRRINNSPRFFRVGMVLSF